MVAVIAVALVHLVLAWMGRSPGLGWGEDDSQYYNLARDLSHFSYRERWDIASPFHARYPPIFPLLLAVVGVPARWNLDAMFLFVALCSAASLIVFFDAARRKVGVQVAFLTTVVLAVNPMALQDAGFLMSEATFKLFLMSGLWGLAREEEGDRFAAIAGAGMIASAMTRSAGIVFLGGLFLYWLLSRRLRWASWLAAASLLTVGVWSVWSLTAPDPQNHRLYTADITQFEPGAAQRDKLLRVPLSMVRRIPERLNRLSTVLIPTVLAFRTVAGTVADNVAWLVVLAVTGIAGLVQLARRWTGAVVVYACYLLLVVTWIWAVGRFITPVSPILILAMLTGTAWLAHRFAPRWRAAALVAMTALLLLGPIPDSMRAVAERRTCDRANPASSESCFPKSSRVFLDIAAWVRDSTPTDAIVMTNKDAAFFTHSGRRVVNQLRALEEDSATIIPFLRSRGVTHAVVGPVGVRLRAHSQLLARACRDLILVKKFPQASAVLRVRKVDEPSDGGASCRALAPWMSLKPRVRRQQ